MCVWQGVYCKELITLFGADSVTFFLWVEFCRVASRAEQCAQSAVHSTDQIKAKPVILTSLEFEQEKVNSGMCETLNLVIASSLVTYAVRTGTSSSRKQLEVMLASMIITLLLPQEGRRSQGKHKQASDH